MNDYIKDALRMVWTLLLVHWIFSGFKVKKEVKLMMDLFGNEYVDYLKKSKAMIPGVI